MRIAWIEGRVIQRPVGDLLETQRRAPAARRVASRQRLRSSARGTIVWRNSKASDPVGDSYPATGSGPCQ